MQVIREGFQIGTWRVEPALNRVTGSRGAAQLEPRVMRVLVCLAQRAGEVVTREALLEEVWGGTVVGDDSLTRSISDLRRTFGDDPQHPRVIETIRSVGYRLIAPVVHDADERASPQGPGRKGPLEAHPATPATAAAARPRFYRLAWPALLGAVALGGLAWMQFARAPSGPSPVPRIPLTSLQGLETDPAFSPDGNLVAFAWTGAQGDNEDIYVKLIDSESLLRLTRSAARDQRPAWSPDGRHIAFIRTQGEGCEVFLVPALGGGERRLAGCTVVPEAGLAWSPDGRWLALPGRPAPGQPAAIFLLSVEAGTLRQVTFPEQAADLYPAFSPDGRRLAFVRFTNERVGDLYVAPLEGGEPKRLTFDDRLILGHAWTPDGRRIIFSSNRAGNRRLWQIPAAGGEAEWLASLATYDPVGPVIAGARRHLAYVEWFMDYNVWRSTLGDGGGEPATPVVTSTRWDRHPSFSPDGSRLAFTSNRSGSNQLWTSDADGANPVRITAFDDAYVSTPRWSPDGRSLAFEVRIGADADVYTIEAAGGLPRQVTFEASDDRAPSWSRDGRWIYFGSNRSGRWQVWRRSLADGVVEQVTRGGGLAAFEAPDGRSLYYTRPTAPGVWHRRDDGGGDEQVLRALQVSDWGNWEVGERGIYYVDRTASDGPHLAFYSFDAGETTTLTSLPGSFPSGADDLAIAPDASSVLYTQNDRQESDIMFVEAFR